MSFRNKLKIRTQRLANSRRTAYWLNAWRRKQLLRYDMDATTRMLVKLRDN